MPQRRHALAYLLTVAAVGALLVAGWWRLRAWGDGLTAVQIFPDRVMGTQCELTAITERARARQAEEVLRQGEQRIRGLEAQMSVFLQASALARFNAAPAGQPVGLPGEVLAVLAESRGVWQASDGTFDVTVLPLVALWRRSAGADREPNDQEIAQVRRCVGMEKLRVEDGSAVKLVDGLSLDLGGVAKGYAVDRAAEVLLAARLPGGLVNLGGNLRCFGATHQRGKWPVWIQHPFAERTCGLLVLGDAAVSTSGNYQRFYEIGGRRYSHILDPRTGRPVEGVPSVTVVSLPVGSAPPRAALADAWSTALSVLGPEGLKRIASVPGLEAMMVTGTPEDHRVHMTDGFRALLAAGSEIELD